jgi:hypothetical protein
LYVSLKPPQGSYALLLSVYTTFIEKTRQKPFSYCDGKQKKWEYRLTVNNLNRLGFNSKKILHFVQDDRLRLLNL